MGNFGFAFPVLAGKDDLLRQSLDDIRARIGEYEESRHRAGITMERVWLQRNPDDSALLPVYIETEGGFEQVLDSFLSGSDFDRWFVEVNKEISGVDLSAPEAGTAPEHIGSWSASSPRRGEGVAFTVPLLAGKAEAARAFGQEAYQARREEMTESRQALGAYREEVFLQRTPMGELITVYAEGENVKSGNEGFAASQSPYDRWFKDQLKELFPRLVDFDQPLPPSQQLWDWRA
jgi:hypothetical protein